MPGRGASTVGTEHMPRNWDELNTDIFSKIFELNTRLSSIYSKSPQPPPKFTCGHSVQLAHTVLTTPWMSLLLWACSWLWAGLRVNRAFPVSAILLQLLLWGFWPRGGQREGSPRPGHQSPLGIWNASQLTCNTRSYHASVNLFQFHCIEHWHSCRREKKCNSDADISISRIFSARSIFKVCVHKQKCWVVQTCPLVSTQIQRQR